MRNKQRLQTSIFDYYAEHEIGTELKYFHDTFKYSNYFWIMTTFFPMTFYNILLCKIYGYKAFFIKFIFTAHNPNQFTTTMATYPMTRNRSIFSRSFTQQFFNRLQAFLGNHRLPCSAAYAISKGI